MDALSFCMYTADAAIVNLAFGVSPRRTSGDVKFRLKNVSGTYSATDVTITITGDRAWCYYLSTDGDTFAAALDLGDLGPGDYSEAVTLRRVTPSDAPLGEEAVELVAAAASWSNPETTGS